MYTTRKQALSFNGKNGAHDNITNPGTDVTLKPGVIETVHRITTDASRLTRTWYQGLLDAGLTDGEYVEVVGTVVAMVSIDSFNKAIGIPLRTLRKPGAAVPTGYRPERLELGEDAWVPMVPMNNSARLRPICGRRPQVVAM